MIPFIKRFATDMVFFISIAIIAVQLLGFVLYWDEGIIQLVTIGLAGLTTATAAKKIGTA